MTGACPDCWDRVQAEARDDGLEGVREALDREEAEASLRACIAASSRFE